MNQGFRGWSGTGPQRSTTTRAPWDNACAGRHRTGPVLLRLDDSVSGAPLWTQLRPRPRSPGQAPEVHLTADVGARTQDHPQPHLRGQQDESPGGSVSPTLRPRSRGGTAQPHSRAELPPPPLACPPLPRGAGGAEGGMRPPSTAGNAQPGHSSGPQPRTSARHLWGHEDNGPPTGHRGPDGEPDPAGPPPRRWQDHPAGQGPPGGWGPSGLPRTGLGSGRAGPGPRE